MATNASIPDCEDYYEAIPDYEYYYANYANFNGSGNSSINTVFYNTPCKVNGTVQPSLRAACLDPLFLFRSNNIISFCDSYYNRQPEPADFYSAPGNESQAFGLTKNYDMDFIVQALDLIDSCLQQYCQSPDPTLGGCPYPSLSHSLFQDVGAELQTTTGVDWDYGPNLTLLQSSEVCDNLVKTTNSDIGGAGVYIAYLMQLSLISIALLLFLSLGPYRSPNINLISVIMSKIKRAPPDCVREKRNKDSIRKAIERSLRVFTSVCVDLQETQCFFVAASLFAALIALNSKSSAFLDATNYSQLQNDCLLLILIELCGLLPIAVVNFILLIFGNWSLEIALLSLVTSSFCAFIYVSNGIGLTTKLSNLSMYNGNLPLLAPIANVANLDK